jgi:hypothetical protein
MPRVFLVESGLRLSEFHDGAAEQHDMSIAGEAGTMAE